MTSPAIQSATLPVLLIEDEPSIMALVSATLERNGYEVVCIESGAEALRLLEKGRFLGVVSDMRTPGGVDGAQVHSWITAQSSRPCRQGRHHHRRLRQRRNREYPAQDWRALSGEAFSCARPDLCR